MAYGSATRIAYLSSPGNQYNGMVTGTSSQDNVRALNATIGTVAAFKSTFGGTSTPPPTAPYDSAPTASPRHRSRSPPTGGSKFCDRDGSHRLRLEHRERHGEHVGEPGVPPQESRATDR